MRLYFLAFINDLGIYGAILVNVILPSVDIIPVGLYGLPVSHSAIF